MTGPAAAKRLCAATLEQARATRPVYDRARVATGIAHIGPGAFHRAHQAFFVDRLLASDPRWGICDVALRGTAVTDALAAQDGLFTIAELAEPERYRIIGSVREALSARRSPNDVAARLASPAVQVVTMTVTENGYCLTPGGDLDTSRPEIVHDLANPDAPASLIGWLALALGRRRSTGVAPFATISCDNVAGNGARLKRALLQFVRDPQLARWIEAEAHFPNTMVDSITPGSDAALIERVAASIGLLDRVPVQREPFVQWAIEDLPDMPGPDWTAAGVTLTSDVTGYENAKLRILNGAHSTLAYLGLLRGLATTREAMTDKQLSAFVRTLLADDIAPSVRAPRGLDVPGYTSTVLARIANPAIIHRLEQIAHDGSQKLAYRLFPVIAEALAAGRPIARLAIPIAGWMRFVVRRTRDKVPLVDPLADQLQKAAQECDGIGTHDVPRFLEIAAPRRLASDERVRQALDTSYDRIGDRGTL